MMAGAEGGAGADLDPAAAGRLVAVVAAVDEEAAGAHRRQPGEGAGHPVDIGQGLEDDIIAAGPRAARSPGEGASSYQASTCHRARCGSVSTRLTAPASGASASPSSRASASAAPWASGGDLDTKPEAIA